MEIQFSAEDTGIGIPAAVLPRIFDRFEQGDSSSTRRHGGSGLGLAIAKELVERMDGEIGARSVENRGSVFWFTLRLPLSAAPAAASFPAAPARVREPINGKVLVAEDNATNQRVTARLLEKLGLQVDLAPDGQAAVRMAASTSYGAILMDCQMPVMDGFEATSEIRRHEKGANRRAPIIALTADVSRENRARCQSAGMDDFIGKPLRLDGLDKVLREWIREDRAPTASPEVAGS